MTVCLRGNCLSYWGDLQILDRTKPRSLPTSTFTDYFHAQNVLTDFAFPSYYVSNWQPAHPQLATTLPRSCTNYGQPIAFGNELATRKPNFRQQKSRLVSAN